MSLGTLKGFFLGEGGFPFVKQFSPLLQIILVLAVCLHSYSHFNFLYAFYLSMLTNTHPLLFMPFAPFSMLPHTHTHTFFSLRSYICEKHLFFHTFFLFTPLSKLFPVSLKPRKKGSMVTFCLYKCLVSQERFSWEPLH